jgi:hypothetical protein
MILLESHHMEYIDYEKDRGIGLQLSFGSLIYHTY